MKLDRVRLVAGGVGVVVGVAATVGVMAYRDWSLRQRCEEVARTVSFYLENDATAEDVEEVERHLLALEDVESLDFVSREEAFEEVRAHYDEELTRTLTPEDLPPHFTLLAEDLDEAIALVNESVPGVDEIRLAQDVECTRKGYVPEPRFGH